MSPRAVVFLACILCVLTLVHPCAAQHVEAAVTVAVIDVSGAVLVGAEVNFTPVFRGDTLKRTHTDQTGRASVSLTPGEYTLVVSVNGFYSVTRQIFVSSNTPQTIALRLYPDPQQMFFSGPNAVILDSPSPQNVKLMGKVVDARGAHVPNARVLLIDLTSLEIQRTLSNDKGEFEFDRLSRTPYEVLASCPSFVTGSAKIFELRGRVEVIDPNPPPLLTVNVKITLAVKSAP